ncbi:MAG: linear amide C-N hydrolase [Chthoniobacterales bacterium]|nr:linear amide C-N hydrolase [Chthoniobacterales bacterium]
MKSKTLLIVGLVSFATALTARACTWFRFLNDQKHCFIGRTMEWPGDLKAEMTRVPREHDFGTFRTKHGFVGISHDGIFSDGINEHGLAASALWLGESKYPDKKSGARPIIELLPLVLGNARTVDEAISMIKENSFYGVTSNLAPELEITLHYAITDATGRSVVVEFLDGKTVVTENKVGAMTNDPNYAKQMEIWSKYDPKKFDEGTFQAFDYSPEGRFCRMAAINATQAKVPDELAAVNRAWSMVNTVDIPQGILYWRWVNDRPQFTSYSVVGDLANRVYYFRTYNNYDIRKVALQDINFADTTYKVDTLFTPPDYQAFKFQ